MAPLVYKLALSLQDGNRTSGFEGWIQPSE